MNPAEALSHRMKTNEPAWAKEYEAMLSAYEQAGGDSSSLKMSNAAILVISANRVLAANEIPGVSFNAEELPNGVRANIKVEPGKQIEKPVHLCFGMLPAEGEQRIIADYEIGAGAKVEFLAHCTFPNAIKLKHIMDANIHVGENASLVYRESHFHGKYGGIEVLPKAKVYVDKGGSFITSFNLVQGRVGKLVFDYDVEVEKNGTAELTTKAYGLSDDQLQVKESLHLNGEGARGLTKTRIAVRDNAVSEVLTTAEGNAAFTIGHMDCTEVVRGRATASNVPKVIVKDDRARVTHEAAIGTVNHRELETLMARGLDEEAAVDIIIRGMLKEGDSK
jgi:Fe-S cluster assembly scaffold protein SufB